MPYAQTNIQLYNQLLLSGWSDPDLRQVHAAYQLAMSICGGLFRPNHKPFLAHLIGTASILAAEGAGSTIVAAGLLHPLYGHGEFGDGSRGVTERKRNLVRRAVGSACEAIVARYASFCWDLTDIQTCIRGAERLSPIDQVAALIKITDTLEDHLDLGMQYSPNKRLPGDILTEEAWCEAVIKLATTLRHESLAAELKRVLHPAGQVEIPEFLRASEASSFAIVPFSHRIRTSVRLGRVYRSVRAKLVRTPEEKHKRAA